MKEFFDFISMTDYNVRVVTIGVVFLGVCSAIVGCFTFLRKQALVGDTVAHSILPGIAFAFMVAQSKDPLLLFLGAFLSGWLSILSVNWIKKNTKLKTDASVGIVLSVFFGLGILLLVNIQQSGVGSQSGLDSFLFGKAAGMRFEDVQLILLGSAIIILFTIVFYKVFKLIIFNIDFAKSIGVNVKLYDVILSSLIVLAISIGIQSVGVVLMAALLITPASAARFWTNKLSLMIILAATFGMVGAIGGAYVSFVMPSAPTGAWIVMFLSLIALLSFLFAPNKGIFYQLRQQVLNSRKIISENVLKGIYHALEKINEDRTIGLNEIEIKRKFKTGELKKGVILLKKRDLIKTIGNSITLTETGLIEARRVVRLHRLWEMYLNQKMNIESDHVHSNAETIEHLITPELEKELEKELNFPQKDPHNSEIPK